MTEIEAREVTERVQGTVQCQICGYWAAMEGYITPEKPNIINFVCPNIVNDVKCGAIEKVINPF